MAAKKLQAACGFAILHFSMIATFTSLAPAQKDPSMMREEQIAPPGDITDLSLEELMNIKVTSASKKEESLSGAPAAIYVITGDDIRRSGLSSLPEVLRLAPGLTVQQTNSHAWTVSTRGFNGFPNEKMLVLIDGRAVYDSLYGGVFWDVQDVRLADIDRIEVIRGPGGALWGVNAVNGVINIITKPASATQGVSVETSLGKNEGSHGSFRVGARMSKAFSYRFYGQSSFWDPAVDAAGTELFNDWHISDAGIRADWGVDSKDNLSFDLAGYEGHVHDQTFGSSYGAFGWNNVAYTVAGGHALAHWGHTISEKSHATTLAYCDWTNRENAQWAEEYRITCDAEFQHNYTFNSRHSLMWGAGFRSTADQTPVRGLSYFTPLNKRLNFFDGFAQYDVNVIPERLRVTIGSKFERSTYGGFEASPQVRAVWSLRANHHIWGAASRSSRVPARNEHDNHLALFNPPQPPDPATVILFIGNPEISSEHQTAYEAGYRYQYKQAWSVDVAAFYNSYTDLILPDVNNPDTSFNPSPPYLQIAFPFKNGTQAQTHGLEINGKWNATPRWHLQLNLTEDRGTSFSMDATPRHQFSANSDVDLPRSFSFHSALYHTNAFDVTAAGATVSLPTTNRVDLGLTWHGMPGLNVGVWGRDLQSDRHLEGNGTSVATGLVRRAVVVKLSWDFNPEKKQP